MTYLRGEADVPCAVCGVPIHRRGRGGIGGQKYCDADCARTAKLDKDRQRRPLRRRDDIHLCPRCRTNPRPARPDGRRRGWCKPCESAQKTEYARTAAGQATLERYLHRHGYVRTEPSGPCEYCGAPVSRRKAVGSGNRRFCNPECRTANTELIRTFPALPVIVKGTW